MCAILLSGTFAFIAAPAMPVAIAQTVDLLAQPSIGLEQCHNDDGTETFQDCSDPIGGGTNYWGNGNANANSATLVEGNSQNYRAILNNMPIGTEQTIKISQQFTKGGKMAYDFPTGPGNIGTATGGIAGIKPCDDGAGGSLVAVCPVFVPSNAAMTGHKLAFGAISSAPIANALVKASTVAAQTAYFATNEGTSPSRSPSEMYIYGATPGLFGVYTFVGSDANVVSGDSELQWTFTFTPTSPTVVITWGAHVSKTPDYISIPKGTALVISGSPYHTSLVSTTFTSGGASQDMQMAGDAIVIPTGTITIIKDTVPNDATNFSYTATGGLATPFLLDDDADATLLNTKTFNAVTANLTYVITEDISNPNYTLTNLVCIESGGQNGVASTVNVGTGVATINLDNGETVTCTYTNTLKQTSLTLIKRIVNDNGGTLTIAGVTLKVDGNTVVNGTKNNLSAGLRTASEDAIAGYTASTWSGDCAADGTVTLALGDDKTCIITNNDIAPPVTTRTQGYWQTHLTQVRANLATGSGNNIPAGNVFTNGGTASGKLVDDLPTLFAAFYSNIPFDSAGDKRPALEKAKMQLSQQLMAAELNCRAFASSPGVDTGFTGLPIIAPFPDCDAPVGTAAGNALNLTADNAANRSEILRVHGLLGAFNESGDANPFPANYADSGLPYVNSKALPKDTKALAKSIFADAGETVSGLTGIQGYDNPYWVLPVVQPFDY